MVNKPTDKFIELASHPDIQAMLMPEVGMWFCSHGDISDIYLIKDGEHAKMIKGQLPDYYILLPDLERLLEKLEEETRGRRCDFGLYTGWQINVWGMDTCNTVFNEFADTSPLIALMALRRVMGIDS